jgi:hypothetical protein
MAVDDEERRPVASVGSDPLDHAADFVAGVLGVKFADGIEVVRPQAQAAAA